MKNLSNMKKDQGFKVPEGYFENLSSRIQEKVEQEERPKHENRFLILKPYLWMAASILGIGLFVKVILTNTLPENFERYKITKQTAVNVDTTSTTEDENTALNWSTEDLPETTSDEIIDYLSDYEIDEENLLANL